VIIWAKGNSAKRDGEKTSAIKCGALCQISTATQGMIEGMQRDSLVFSGFDAREN
jgi:hypothetical protein